MYGDKDHLSCGESSEGSADDSYRSEGGSQSDGGSSYRSEGSSYRSGEGSYSDDESSYDSEEEPRAYRNGKERSQSSRGGDETSQEQGASLNEQSQASSIDSTINSLRDPFPKLNNNNILGTFENEFETDPDEFCITSKENFAANPRLDSKSSGGVSLANDSSSAISNSKPESRRKIGYGQEEMSKLGNTPQNKKTENDRSRLKPENEPTAKKTRRRKRKSHGKNKALIELASNVNDTMKKLEEKNGSKQSGRGDSTDTKMDLTPRRLLYGFDSLVGILLQLSDELELMKTFATKKNAASIKALRSLLSFAPTLDELFAELKPIVQEYLEKEIDEEMNDFLYGMNLIVDLLCESTYRVGEKQEWNARANTAYVTLLELLARDALEVVSIHADVDTPEHVLSENLQSAWEATGHVEEFKTLEVTSDLAAFRQIAYEVILSTDQWCPDTNTLMDTCGIDPEMLEERQAAKPNPNETLEPAPETALQVLEKINGDGLPRTATFINILRRILPGHAVTDSAILDNFVNIRSTLRNPLGLLTSNMIAISSIAETLDDPKALGVAGVGKTTLAAMVANYPDVRRFFCDGVAWVNLGHRELNYTRYIQCLGDMISQLRIEEDEEPLFPELLHIPGESKAKRRRREEGFMIYVRDAISDFLYNRSVLIILDNACFEPDLDWFDFMQDPTQGGQEDQEYSCVVLVTTRIRNLLPAADTVEVDLLEEGEAVELLVQESGDLSHSLVTESPEVRSVVLECANHPLAVKSVGRWLNLKHATAGVVSSVEEIHKDVVKSMDKILKNGNQDDADMMYEILNMSLSPAVNGEPTNIIKFCLAAFVLVFCNEKQISDFALADTSPIVPLAITELLIGSLLNLEEETLLQEGSLFFAQKKEASILIPEALSALGVLKVIVTLPESSIEGEQPKGDNEDGREEGDKYVQIMHSIQQEYGEFLLTEDDSLTQLALDAELRWNRAFAQAYLGQPINWDTELPDAGMDYALEMMPSHMIRGGMYSEASNLLNNSAFVRGRLFALGRENAAHRHIKDCESLFDALAKKRRTGKKRLDPKSVMKQAYQTLGELLDMDESEFIQEEGSPEAVEIGRVHFDMGFSLSEKRCWEAAITHFESSQELLVSSLGMVEFVAGILYNVGVVYAEMNEYEQALGSLKQCLKIRGAIHGEEHILYAQTIQKIGDIFLGMSDYQEAIESYNWALDVMHIEPDHHRIDIGDILENMGNIHYSKGEIDDSLECYQDALKSKQMDINEDHPDLATAYHHIGNCLSDQGKTDEAIFHFKEAIRLKELDPDGDGERDADVLTIKGVLHNLKGKQQAGLDCYEKALQILVTKVPHKKEKVASLLHLIGCVYLKSGEHKKAMKLFEESLQARRKVLGFVHLDVASTLFNMAFLHQTRNRLDKALKCLEEALKIRQLRLPDSEKVAVTHEKIGALARSIGKTKKAEIAFGEALRIRKLIHGDGHENVATVLQELGNLMDDLGEYDEAMKQYVEALDIRQKYLGPDDLAVAETLYGMGFTLQNNKASERALQCFEEALKIRKFQLGADANEVGDTLNMMGFLQVKQGMLDDGLSLLRDALRIRKLQEDKVKVSETLKNIGNIHGEKQEHELAMDYFEECLHIRRTELGNDHEKVADALIAMGNVQSDMGKTREAMQSYKEALTIRTALFGELDESVALVLQCMGTLEFRTGAADKALPLLNEFVQIRQEINSDYADYDEDYVNVLFMIGNIHKMRGNEEEAQRCLTEAYEIFQELGLADGNPSMADVMDNLIGKGSGSGDNVIRESYQSNSMSKQQKGMLGRLSAKVNVRGRRKDRGQQLNNF